MVLKKLFIVDPEVNGKGPSLFAWQREGGNLLACTGVNRRVTLVDRQGKTVHQIPLPGTTNPLALAWDSTGEVLAVIQEKCPTLTVYTVTTKKAESIDTGLKEPTFLSWSRGGPYLAVGSAKGHLLFYNRTTQRKNVVTGTHSKSVLSGSWNRANQLATVSEDKVLAISDAEGAVLDTSTLKAPPSSVSFADGSDNATKAGSIFMILVNLGGKSLLLRNTKTKEDFELKFNPKYGNIAAATFFGEGYLLVGFVAGYTVVVSTHAGEVGNEVSSHKSHREQLVSVNYCRAITKGCAVGDGVIRTYEMDDNRLHDSKNEKIESESLFNAMLEAAWTDDGQILTISSKHGGVHSYLTKLPVLSDAYGSNVMYLSSLRELTVRDMDQETTVCRVPVDIEPAFACLGPGVLAAGMNNQVFYYTFTKGGSKALTERTYGGIVEAVKVSSQFAALLVEGRLLVHPLTDKGPHGAKQQVTMPDKDGKVIAFSITENFLAFGTAGGTVGMFSLVDYEQIVNFRHNGNGIRALSTNMHGTRIAFIDASNGGFILNPTTEVATSIENFNTSTKRLIWDPSEYGVLVGVDPKHFTTYCYAPHSRHGATCEPVCAMDARTFTPTSKVNYTNIPFAFTPIGVFRGSVSCQMASGSLASILLESHRSVYSNNKLDTDGFLNNLNLNRLTQAAALAINHDQLRALAAKALHLLDIELAIRVHRLLNLPAIVMCLEKLRHVKEKNMLLGHVSMITGNFNDAQNFFTRSTRPVLALEMRRDLLQWDHALHLAKTLSPEQVPLISREYAQQLEFRGEYAKALDVYQQGRMAVPQGHQGAELDAQVAQVKHHNDLCDAGAARCMVRTGSIRAGVQLAQSIGSSSAASLECARILEVMGQFDEAANLYEHARQYEKAVTLHITETKNLKAAGRLLPHISSRNILVMFARAKETQQGAFGEAEKAYEMAEDWDNVVRIKVEHMNDLHGAYIIVRQTKSAEAAAMVAKMCRKKGENGPAVEFLVMARRIQDAFDLAQQSNCMTNFEEALIAQVPLREGLAPANRRNDFLLIANYYDQRKKPRQAAQYFRIAGNFQHALDRYMDVNDAESTQQAVEVVGAARSDALTNRLIDFLMGERDGEPKDPTYIFKLYMALGNFEKAGKTALLIATREQEAGNYRAAHKVLVDTALVLQAKQIRVPSDLRRTLMLLHSYIIVKHLVKPLDDMDNATRMLLRVSRNIQKFPAHIATILTSTVLQCLKVDFKASAFTFACTIIQNDKYRAELNEKHKKKVESIVRKKGKEELNDPSEASSPCPLCSAPCLETALECGSCKNALPFCIVTGKHMVVEQWSQCPSCKFPALFDPLTALIKDTPQCPMCDQFVDINALEITRNPDVKSFV